MRTTGGKITVEITVGIAVGIMGEILGVIIPIQVAITGGMITIIKIKRTTTMTAITIINAMKRVGQMPILTVILVVTMAKLVTNNGKEILPAISRKMEKNAKVMIVAKKTRAQITAARESASIRNARRMDRFMRFTKIAMISGVPTRLDKVVTQAGVVEEIKKMKIRAVVLTINIGIPEADSVLLMI